MALAQSDMVLCQQGGAIILQTNSAVGIVPPHNLFT